MTVRCRRLLRWVLAATGLVASLWGQPCAADALDVQKVEFDSRVLEAKPAGVGLAPPPAADIVWSLSA